MNSCSAVRTPKLGLFILLLANSTSGAETPEQFLDRAKENLCWNFLRGPDVGALLTHTWRREAFINELSSKGKQLKTWPYRLFEKFRSPQGMRVRLISHEQGQDVTIERSARGAKPCSWCYPRCDAYGTRLRNIVWSLSEFTFLGKEMLDGRPAMTYSFRTAPKIPQKYKSDEKLKFLLKFAIGTEGALWIDEEDRIAFRCEGRNYKTVVRSPGFLVGGSEIRKGSRWEWHLEKSESTWFPTEIRQKIPYLNRFRRRIRETVWRFDNFRMIQ